jgi:endonuclease-3
MSSRRRRRTAPPRATEARRKQVTRILARLEKMYGPRTRDQRTEGSCLDVLVHSMLAQNTNMSNANSGWRQLRREFRSWRQVMDAPVRDVQRCIAVCGLARMRARRLQRLLQRIDEQNGKLDLQFLAERSPQDAYDYLMSFFGIGPKTAACTLLFAFGMPMFPVDNGILRVARRLRLVRPKARDVETSTTVQCTATARQCYPLHVLMFTHAKQKCRPRNPRCDECRLVEMCPHGKRRLRHRPAETIEECKMRLRPIILSRRAGDGIPKNGDDHDKERVRR